MTVDKVVEPKRANNISEVWNSRVTKSFYEAELRKMTSHLELQTQKCL